MVQEVVGTLTAIEVIIGSYCCRRAACSGGLHEAAYIFWSRRQRRFVFGLFEASPPGLEILFKRYIASLQAGGRKRVILESGLIIPVEVNELPPPYWLPFPVRYG